MNLKLDFANLVTVGLIAFVAVWVIDRGAQKFYPPAAIATPNQ